MLLGKCGLWEMADAAVGVAVCSQRRLSIRSRDCSRFQLEEVKTRMFNVPHSLFGQLQVSPFREQERFPCTFERNSKEPGVLWEEPGPYN